MAVPGRRHNPSDALPVRRDNEDPSRVHLSSLRTHVQREVTTVGRPERWTCNAAWGQTPETKLAKRSAVDIDDAITDMHLLTARRGHPPVAARQTLAASAVETDSPIRVPPCELVLHYEHDPSAVRRPAWVKDRTSCSPCERVEAIAVCTDDPDREGPTRPVTVRGKDERAGADGGSCRGDRAHSEQGCCDREGGQSSTGHHRQRPCRACCAGDPQSRSISHSAWGPGLHGSPSRTVKLALDQRQFRNGLQGAG